MIEKKHVSLNLNVRGLTESATLAVQARVRDMRKANQRVYDLGLGQSPFPVPAPMVEALKLNAFQKDYLPVAGLPQLREAVADYHHKKDQVDVDPQQVLIGPGSKELMFLLQLAFYGEIIVPTPCWVSYTPQSRILGRNVRLIPTRLADDWKMTPQGLVDFFESQHDPLRPRLLVINYPANPTGITYSEDELREIARVAREYEVMLLSDEIYSGLHFEGEHVSIARFYPERTIIGNGISKWAGAGGWRLGSFAFPRELSWLRETMCSVASETYTSVSAPIQHAAVRAYQGGQTIERYLIHVRRILKTLGFRVHRMLKDAGVRVARPQGAYYLFPVFSHSKGALAKRGIKNSRQLCERLLAETGVAMLPGVAFERPPEELSARMSLVDFDGAMALARSETVALDRPLPDGFLETSCGQLLEGMETVVGWLEGDDPARKPLSDGPPRRV